MKKVFLMAVAAVAMLASCSNDETTGKAVNGNTIKFSNTFVNNGTRSVLDPSFTKESLGNFKVYGYTQNGCIFDGVTVSSNDNGASWTYSPTKWWIQNNTYTFGAIAPAATAVSNPQVTNGKVTMDVSFTNNGTTDLLHAAPAVVTADENFMASPAPVAMSFNHQLSKVKFSFENSIGAGYTMKITNIQIKNAKANGKLTVAEAGNSWSEQTGETNLNFGAASTTGENEAEVIANGSTVESYKEMLMIPTAADAEYNVGFTFEVLDNNVTVGTYEKTATIKGVELKLGYCYNFKVALTVEDMTDPDNPESPKPIVFTVSSVENWNDAEVDQNATVDEVPETQEP